MKMVNRGCLCSALERMCVFLDIRTVFDKKGNALFIRQLRPNKLKEFEVSKCISFSLVWPVKMIYRPF